MPPMPHIRRTAALFSLLLLSATTAFAEPVKTANGLIEGTTEKDLRIFQGIPFAAPPVGELRWKAPQPVQNWNGVKHGTGSARSACSAPSSATWCSAPRERARTASI